MYSLERPEKVRVAAVQASPVFPLSKQACIDKVVDLIEEAGKNGAQLTVFPETFVPAYPSFSVDLMRPNEWRDNLVTLTKEAVDVGSDDLKPVMTAARQWGMVAVLGINEREFPYQGQLYNSLAFISNQGELLGVHRKLVPSNRERCFWGRGDGSTLNVYDTSAGRIGGLICYEHLQPLLKHTLQVQGEQIHCAAWPGWPNFKNGRSNKKVIETAVRAYALEGQCFVVAGSIYVPPQAAEVAGLGNTDWSYFGGACIVDPNGEMLAGPLYDQEGILYADIDLDDILRRKVAIDTNGRDQRWDVLQIHYNPQPYKPFANRPAPARPQPVRGLEREAVAE